MENVICTNVMSEELQLGTGYLYYVESDYSHLNGFLKWLSKTGDNLVLCLLCPEEGALQRLQTS